jgi:hypothetical protein
MIVKEVFSSLMRAAKLIPWAVESDVRITEISSFAFEAQLMHVNTLLSNIAA